MKHTQKGFNLLELMLVLAFIVAAGAGVYKLFGSSTVQAGVQKEQKDVGVMVDKIIGNFVAYPNFQPLNTATVAGIMNMTGQYNDTTKTIPSNIKYDLKIEPDKLVSDNDSFRLTYKNVDRKTCVALIPALAARSNGVFIGTHSNIQLKASETPDGATISNQCGSNTTSDVAFRFSADKSNFAATSMNSCLCAPETETQTLACSANSAGSITQRRTGTCSGGTPACPSIQWSSWVTASNTCGANANPVVPVAPVAPVAPQTCIPSVETQTVACPTGQVGGILQQRTRICPANTFGAWTNVSSSCQPNPNRPSCTPKTERQIGFPCTDQFGNIDPNQKGTVTKERASTCDANGNEVWSTDWKTINNTCSSSCVADGNCCSIVRDTDQTRDVFCPTGQWGRQYTVHSRTSVCPTAYSTTGAQWGAWIQQGAVRGSCAVCQPVPQSETQRVTVDRGCPAGFKGSNTYVSVQTRNRTGTFNCTQGSNLTQPSTPDNWTAWSAWSEISQESPNNQCVADTPMCSDGSAQVASWAIYNANSDYDYYQRIANSDNNRGTTQSSASYDQSFQVGNNASSYLNLGNCTLNTLGAVGVAHDQSFECVSNMGMHYCDYTAQTQNDEAYRCVSACESSFSQYGFGQAIVDGQSRQVRRAMDFRQLPWNQSNMSWARPSYPGVNAPGGAGGGTEAQLYRTDSAACEGNPYQQYEEFKWSLKNPNGGVESGTCRINRSGNTYSRTCSGTYNGQAVPAVSGDRDTAYNGLPYKNTWEPANTRTECVAGERYEAFACYKGSSVIRDVASCNK